MVTRVPVYQSCVERVILLSENLLHCCIFLLTVVKCIAVNIQNDLSAEPSGWYVQCGASDPQEQTVNSSQCQSSLQQIPASTQYLLVHEAEGLQLLFRKAVYRFVCPCFHHEQNLELAQFLYRGLPAFQRASGAKHHTGNGSSSELEFSFAEPAS